jgi:hypothetical protein
VHIPRAREAGRSVETELDPSRRPRLDNAELLAALDISSPVGTPQGHPNSYVFGKRQLLRVNDLLFYWQD